LDTMDDEVVEVVIRIDGCGSLGGATGGGAHTTAAGSGGIASGLFGGECLGRGCGEGIELRAEVEAMSAEGKVIKKRALAQIMIWNPYQAQVSAIAAQAQQQGQAGSVTSSFSAGGNGSTAATGPIAGSAMATGQHHVPHHRQLMSHHCTGIRVAKIKAVLPSETVVGAGGIRKGVVHIYAGRKVENVSALSLLMAITTPCPR
jgi:hypothetical protein